jgi:hypothetical protein
MSVKLPAKPVSASTASKTTVECVLNAHKAHSGAHPPTNASMSADRTQPSHHQPMPVSATLDSECSMDSAKPAQPTTSSPMDTV